MPITDAYLIANQNKFPKNSINFLADRLRSIPAERQSLLHAIPLKDPIITLVLSLLLGGFGVDRFYLGDIFLGILKFISVIFVLGWIWVIIDIFICYNKTKEQNLNILMLHT